MGYDTIAGVVWSAATRRLSFPRLQSLSRDASPAVRSAYRRPARGAQGGGDGDHRRGGGGDGPRRECHQCLPWRAAHQRAPEGVICTSIPAVTR